MRRAAAFVAACLAGAFCVTMAASAQRSAATLKAFDEVWQTINDSFFDPTFGGQSWTAVRDELRPRVERASSDDDGRKAIREMLARLGQSHLSLIGPSDDPGDFRGEQTVPFDVRVAGGDAVLVTRVWPEGHAAGVDVKPGDRVLVIDGREVASFVAADQGASDRVRALLLWRRVANALSGPSGSRVRMRVRTPAGVELDVALARVEAPGVSVTVGNLPVQSAYLDAVETHTSSGRRVGIIRFNIWMAPLGEPFAQAIDRFRRADGLIIDLRGNPGGLADMIRGVAGHLLSEPAVLGRMHMRQADLEFRANPRFSTSDGRRVQPYAGPVALLVDGLTGSASECFAGGLQSLNRVRVFGTTSMGQALPASTKQLSNGDVLLYAIGDFVTSTGLRLEGRGVVPDEVVALTPENLAAGHDAEDAAIAWLDTAPRPGG
ncbi:MAG: S41 family peptidase [Acidobacteriota bacterium]